MSAVSASESDVLLTDRSAIHQKLSEKNWFKKTGKKLQQELLSLPSEFDGFLNDLINRPEQVGLVEVVRLKKLSAGNYMIIPVFEVRSVHTKQLFTYEYVSWRHGRFGGYRGIILIEVDNKIQYFLIKKGEKFPTAALTYDAIGTNQFSLLSPKKFFLQSNIENQIKKLLELDEIRIRRYIDLGVLNPDPGMTNNHVGLFAMILHSDYKQLLEQSVTNRRYQSSLPVGYQMELYPISRIYEFISECNDGYFLACISRLIASHIITV